MLLFPSCRWTVVGQPTVEGDPVAGIGTGGRIAHGGVHKLIPQGDTARGPKVKIGYHTSPAGVLPPIPTGGTANNTTTKTVVVITNAMSYVMKMLALVMVGEVRSTETRVNMISLHLTATGAILISVQPGKRMNPSSSH